VKFFIAGYEKDPRVDLATRGAEKQSAGAEENQEEKDEARSHNETPVFMQPIHESRMFATTVFVLAKGLIWGVRSHAGNKIHLRSDRDKFCPLLEEEIF